MSYPEWPNYVFSEKTTMSLVRGLRGMSGEWGKFIATAQAVIGYFQDVPRNDAARLYDEDKVLPLIAASRILDSASTTHSGLAEAERRDYDDGCNSICDVWKLSISQCGPKSAFGA